jgi:glucose/arabinose dehydrogenase
LPPGFSLIKYADLTWPTSLAFDDEDRLYAASNDGTIHVFIDEDKDGRADQDVIVASDFRLPLGIAIHPESGDVYVSSLGRITILRNIEGDLKAHESIPFVTRLPYDWHQCNNLKFGPDGLLYLGIGSTCNACEDEDPRSATIMRFDLESADGEIYATGLRNSYDIAFHPITGDLFATDNGRDDLGEDLPNEELNHIIQGGDYGYPNCWDESTQPGCKGKLKAITYFEPHSSANSLVFQVSDLLPDAYTFDDDVAVAYVAIYGAWHVPDVATGIIRVQLTETGDTYEGQVDWFAKWPGSPLGLAISLNGDLFVGDYKNQAIYRISYGS